MAVSKKNLFFGEKFHTPKCIDSILPNKYGWEGHVKILSQSVERFQRYFLQRLWKQPFEKNTFTVLQTIYTKLNNSALRFAYYQTPRDVLNDTMRFSENILKYLGRSCRNMIKMLNISVGSETILSDPDVMIVKRYCF